MAQALDAGELQVIGKIASPYGVKGWVKVHSFTEPMENFLKYRHFYIRKGGQADGQWQAIELDDCRSHGKGLIAHIAGVDTPERARLYSGTEVAVPVGDMPELEDDEYYWHQLEGLRVLGRAAEGGELLLGEVDHLLATGANDVMVVRPCDGSIDQRERMIPYVPGMYVVEVDLAAGHVRVDWDPEF